MKNHFVYCYYGNKRMEVKHIYDGLRSLGDPLIRGYSVIIEPYCGSSAMSFYIAQRNPKSFKYILNDNDPLLIQLYKILASPSETEAFETRINAIVKTIREAPEDKRKEIYNGLDKKTLEGNFILTKYHNIRVGLYPAKCKWMDIRLNAPIIDFLRNENVEIRQGDGMELIKEMAHDERNIILVDPPYMFSSNSEYKVGNIGTFEIYEYLQKYEGEARLYAVLELTWFIKIIYENRNMVAYDKTYTGIRKKKTTHGIINFCLKKK